MSIRRLLSVLSPVDFISTLFLFLMTFLNLLFYDRVVVWKELVLINIVVVAVIVSIAWVAESRKTRLLVGIHRWYCYLLVLFVFKEIYQMIHRINPTDYDQMFIAIDHWMFGVNPTQWLYQFSHPLITEILQTAYFSYYLIFILVGVEIFRRYPIDRFDHAAFLIVYGFYLSYLGYFLFPAVGPRFTLHNFADLSHDLPGLFLTPIFRAIINAGESIPLGSLHPIELVQRDVFPSGHTQLTLVCTYLAFHYRLHSKWPITILASLLIIATVYLRYHYVIDVVGGVAFFLLTVWTGNKLESWWNKFSALKNDRV
jgi:membrane-associated phospholipid phosphatase